MRPFIVICCWLFFGGQRSNKTSAVQRSLFISLFLRDATMASTSVITDVSLSLLDEGGAWVADDPVFSALDLDNAQWRHFAPTAGPSRHDCQEYIGSVTVAATDIPPLDGTIVNGWTLLRYKEGGHFGGKHADTQLSPLPLGMSAAPFHTATILVLPPLSVASHTGGELVVFGEDGSVAQMLCAHATKWLMIVLPLGTLHQVLPVTSGARYVLKTALRGAIDTAPVLKSKTSSHPRGDVKDGGWDDDGPEHGAGGLFGGDDENY